MPLAEATALLGAASGNQTGVRMGNPSCAKGDEKRDGLETHFPEMDGLETHPTETCTGLFLAAYDPQADREALEKLAQWCERFSPLAGLEMVEQRYAAGTGSAKNKAAEPQCLLLDVTSLGPLFGGEQALADKVALEFQQRGYAVRLAIADNIGAAWAIAHFATQNAECGSSDCGLPNVSSIVPSQSEGLSPQSAIEHLPVEALRLPAETVDVLHQLGIFQIEQLLRLPRASLSSRLGDQLLKRLDQATGAATEVIQACRTPPEFQAEWLLEHPVERREAVDQILEQLVQRVAGLLAGRDRGAIQLQCRLDCAASDPLYIRVGLFRPTAAARHLIELVRMQLEQIKLAGPVGRVGVQAVTTAPLESRQGQLFADQVRQATEQLAMLVDRLSSRLGRECVLRASLQADAQPERACRYTALTGQWNRRPRTAKSHPQQAAGSTAPSPTARPLLLHAPPLPLEVVSVVPDGPPVSFRYQHHPHRVAAHWGPERIETGWWRGRLVRRDYYRVETEAGNRFWLFRNLEDGKWFLQGEFE
jgi:protein ImuB